MTRDDQRPKPPPEARGRFQSVLLGTDSQARAEITDQGLILFDREGKLVAGASNEADRTAAAFRCGFLQLGAIPEALFVESREEIWVATERAIRRFDLAGLPLDWSFRSSGRCERLAASSKNQVAAAFQIGSGTLASGRVVIFSPDGDALTETTIPKPPCTLRWIDTGTLTVATADSLSLLTLDGRKLRELQTWDSGIFGLRCVDVSDARALITGHHGGALERRTIGRRDLPTREETGADWIQDLRLIGNVLAVWLSDGRIELRLPTNLALVGMVNEPRLERAPPRRYHRLGPTPEGGLILPIDEGRELLTLPHTALDPWQLGPKPNLTDRREDPQGRWVFDPRKQTFSILGVVPIELSLGETELIALLAEAFLKDPSLTVPEERLQASMSRKVRTTVLAARKKLAPFGIGLPRGDSGRRGYRLMDPAELERLQKRRRSRS